MAMAVLLFVVSFSVAILAQGVGQKYEKITHVMCMQMMETPSMKPQTDLQEGSERVGDL